ncbi:Galactitol-1-phosphate 5-dehydrogenase, partial [Salmonella enterica subsp. enterica serovar Give str. S5-487]
PSRWLSISPQLALVGTLHHDLTLTTRTFGLILRKELTLLGSWMNYSAPWPGEEWETAARLLAEKRLQLTPLIAHRGDAESFAEAVKALNGALQKQSKRLMALNGAPMQGKILLQLS